MVIYGTGGFAREVHQVLEDVNADAARFRFLGGSMMTRQAQVMQFTGTQFSAVPRGSKPIRA